jgi:hypothetical protein
MMLRGPPQITPDARIEGYNKLSKHVTMFVFFVVSARYVLPRVFDLID